MFNCHRGPKEGIVTFRELLRNIREQGEELVLYSIAHKGQPISTIILFFRGGFWIIQTTTSIGGEEEVIEEVVTRDVALQEVRSYLAKERERRKRRR